MDQLLDHTTELFHELQADLQKIGQEPVSLLVRSEQSYSRAVHALSELKACIRGYTFTSEQEEITFFKETKPKFLREMLFHLKLLQIESYKPMGSLEDLNIYYQGQISQVQNYIARNQVLYLYNKLDKKHLDKKMFVQDPEQLLTFPHYNVESDSPFSNIYSFRLAKIQASEDLILELKQMIQSGSHDLLERKTSAQGPPPLVWQGTQAQFYEAVLAFVKTGVLGDITIKAAMDWLGYCLTVNTGHYYRYFQAMRIRKKGRVPYLNKCAKAVEDWMDECDENPKFH